MQADMARGLRYGVLDALRGLAVAGMVIGHTVAVLWWKPAQSALLFVFTIFVTLAGAFARPRLGRRYWLLVAGFAVSWWPAWWMGLTTFGVLGKWLLVLPVYALVPEIPLLVWAMAGTYLACYGDPGFGVLVLGWALGRAMGRDRLAIESGEAWWDDQRGVCDGPWAACVRGVEWMGRHSLGAYVWHLWALAGVVALVRL
jgi:uncharacterized membrane protein